MAEADLRKGGAVSISGLTINVSGAIVQISGQSVQISGQSVITDSGSVTSVSGNIIIAQIGSGELVCAFICGGCISTSVSGNIVQIVNTSGIAFTTILSPILKANLQNVALPISGTNILTSGITPTNSPSAFKIQTAIDIPGDLSTIINSSMVFLNTPLTPLVSNVLTEYRIFTLSGDLVNLRYDQVSGTIKILRIYEVDSFAA